jgi:hypothetical protein
MCVGDDGREAGTLEGAHHLAEVPLAREHQRVGLARQRGIGAAQHRHAGGDQRLLDAVQVAGSVIDQHDAHGAQSVPLVLGSVSCVVRVARCRALRQRLDGRLADVVRLAHGEDPDVQRRVGVVREAAQQLAQVVGGEAVRRCPARPRARRRGTPVPDRSRTTWTSVSSIGTITSA